MLLAESLQLISLGSAVNLGHSQYQHKLTPSMRDLTPISRLSFADTSLLLLATRDNNSMVLALLSTCNTVTRFLLSIRNCYKAKNSIRKLLEGGLSSLDNIKKLAPQVSVFFGGGLHQYANFQQNSKENHENWRRPSENRYQVEVNEQIIYLLLGNRKGDSVEKYMQETEGNKSSSQANYSTLPIEGTTFSDAGNDDGYSRSPSKNRWTGRKEANPRKPKVRIRDAPAWTANE